MLLCRFNADGIVVVPNISEQIKEQNGKCVAFALLGGFILSIGNICLQYTVALLGLSAGVPFICALTIVVGGSLLLVPSCGHDLKWRPLSSGCLHLTTTLCC
jgi:hypothetical protein